MKSRGSAPSSRGIVATVLRCLAGPLIWALHFATIYSFQHAFCMADRPSEMWVGLVVGLATAIAAIAATALTFATRFGAIWNAEHGVATFLDTVARWLTLLSVFGILLEGMAVFFVDACAAMR
jgi:hypothetical protein